MNKLLVESRPPGARDVQAAVGSGMDYGQLMAEALDEAKDTLVATWSSIAQCALMSWSPRVVKRRGTSRSTRRVMRHSRAVPFADSWAKRPRETSRSRPSTSSRNSRQQPRANRLPCKMRLELCSTKEPKKIFDHFLKVLGRPLTMGDAEAFGRYLLDALIGRTVWDKIKELAKNQLIELSLHRAHGLGAEPPPVGDDARAGRSVPRCRGFSTRDDRSSAHPGGA